MATQTLTQNHLLQEEPTPRQAIITIAVHRAETIHTTDLRQEAAQHIAAQVEAQTQEEVLLIVAQVEVLTLEVHHIVARVAAQEVLTQEVLRQEVLQVVPHQEDHQAHQVHQVEVEDN